MFLARDAVAAAAEVAEHSAGPGAVAQLAEKEEPDEGEDQQPGNQRDQDGHQQILAVFGLDVGSVGMIQKPDQQALRGGHGGHIATEVRDAILGTREGPLFLEFSLDRVSLDDQPLDVALRQFALHVAQGHTAIGALVLLEQQKQENAQRAE